MHFLGAVFFVFNVSAEKALLERRKLIDHLPSNVSNASQHELILLIKQRLRSSRDEQIACSSEFECYDCADMPSTIMILIEKSLDCAMQSD